MNYWKNIPIGDNPPDTINVVVEVISQTRDKYEYNVDWEAFVLDRVLHSSTVFPVEYGFIPRTWYYDNDPLDVMVLCSEPSSVGCIIKARVIGALIMEDEKGEDSKILCVPINDPRFDGIDDIRDIHRNKLKEIQDFYENYKNLEPNKFTKFKAWKNSDVAKKIVSDAIILGREKLKQKQKKILIRKGDKTYCLIPQ